MIRMLTLMILFAPLLNANNLSEELLNFTLQLEASIQPNKDNILIAPFSIYTSLSMPYMGAQGDTLDAFENTFFRLKNREKVAEDILFFLNYLHQDTTPELAIQHSNAVWIEERLFYLPNYKSLLEKNFKAQTFTFDSTSPLVNTEHINRWVNIETEGRIPSLIDPSYLITSTALIFVNTFYFKGAWQHPFHKKNTTQGPFKSLNNGEQKVEMMRKRLSLSYFEDLDYQVTLLPFKTSSAYANYALMLILPKLGKPLINCNLKSLEKWITQFEIKLVELKLPKFKFEEKLDFTSLLKQAGLGVAFSSEANFSSITGSRNLAIGNLSHCCSFSIDEEGAEAAAATSTSMNMTSNVVLDNAIDFNVNHPFMFVLLETTTKMPLLIGRVNNIPCN